MTCYKVMPKSESCLTYHSSFCVLSAPPKRQAGVLSHAPYVIDCPSKDNRRCWEFQADAHQSLMTALRSSITCSWSSSPSELTKKSFCLSAVLWWTSWKYKRHSEKKMVWKKGCPKYSPVGAQLRWRLLVTLVKMCYKVCIFLEGRVKVRG